MTMKRKVVVKIFLPIPKTAGPVNQTEYLYGEIKCEDKYERACRQVFIFITSRRPERVTCRSARTQCIGEINTNQRKYNQNEVGKDYVWLQCNSNAPDVIRLKDICLPASAPDPECQFKVQIIVYEPKAFLKLSQDDGEFRTNTAVSDPIAHLIQILRHNEKPNKSPQTWCSRLQHFLWVVLMTVNRMLLHKLPRVNESAFLRHFYIWLNSIKLFTFKRLVTALIQRIQQILDKYFVLDSICSGKAWTIVFDVTFGMILMLILLRVSDPGEYLLKFTKVRVILRTLIDAFLASHIYDQYDKFAFTVAHRQTIATIAGSIERQSGRI